MAPLSPALDRGPAPAEPDVSVQYPFMGILNFLPTRFLAHAQCLAQGTGWGHSTNIVLIKHQPQASVPEPSSVLTNKAAVAPDGEVCGPQSRPAQGAFPGVELTSSLTSHSQALTTIPNEGRVTFPHWFLGVFGSTVSMHARGGPQAGGTSVPGMSGTHKELQQLKSASYA